VKLFSPAVYIGFKSSAGESSKSRPSFAGFCMLALGATLLIANFAEVWLGTPVAVATASELARPHIFMRTALLVASSIRAATATEGVLRPLRKWQT
jgi:hypothetical protein